MYKEAPVKVAADDWVTLAIEGREGCAATSSNKHGSFEFEPTLQPYKKYIRRSMLLKGCEGNYGDKGLISGGIVSELRVGFVEVQKSCKILSDYAGELPVPTEVRKACVTLLLYGPKSVKHHTTYDAANASLLWNSISLGTLRPGLSYHIKPGSFRSNSLL